MNINLSLENKQINPGVINLRQFTTGTDTLVFEMDNFMYETTDLSKMDAYAVCDMSGRIDEVKLTKSIVEDKLRVTWNVTGYTTDIDGTITYQIVFKNIENEKAIIWTSHKAIIFVNSSIEPDGYIAAEYPTILQQWEERMKTTDESASESAKNAQESANKAEQSASNALQSATKAENEATDAEKSANKAEHMKDAVSELINYEGTSIIEKEVAEARAEFPLLGNRLNDQQSRIEFMEENGTVSGDTIPVGGRVAYDGDIIPKGWEVVEEYNENGTVVKNGIDILLGRKTESYYVENPINSPLEVNGFVECHFLSDIDGYITFQIIYGDSIAKFKNVLSSNKWMGWKLVDGEVNLWTGNMIGEQTETIENLSFYNKFRIEVSDFGYIEIDVSNNSNRYSGYKIGASADYNEIFVGMAFVEIGTNTFKNKKCLLVNINDIQNAQNYQSKSIYKIVGLS